MFGWKDIDIKIIFLWDNFRVNLCTFKIESTNKIYLHKQYFLFLFLKYHWKNFQFQNCLIKTCKNKIVIITVVKSNSRVDLGQGLGHCLGWPLTRVNKKIKMVIIIILKPNLEVDSGQDPGHRSGGSTLVELG